jgi:hypothetical protein
MALRETTSKSKRDLEEIEDFSELKLDLIKASSLSWLRVDR